MLNVVMLSATFVIVMLSGIKQSVIMTSVVAPQVKCITLNLFLGQLTNKKMILTWWYKMVMLKVTIMSYIPSVIRLNVVASDFFYTEATILIALV